MRAVVFERFGERPEVRELPDPAPSPDGVVVRVEATGVCRSDWHGWQGHDPDIALPHVPGHELSGTVAATGARVTRFRAGDRVTVPFVCACGSCAACAQGDHQVCENQTQPGFTRHGSFAEYVALDHADTNLVALPDGLAHPTAAGLGCRFATAHRAVTVQGRVAPGEWVAVHGCGGVGLSAVMIAAAAGARVLAVDVSPDALELARRFGAEVCLDARVGVVPVDGAVRAGAGGEVAAAVRELTGGGAHLSLDALGSPGTCVASVEGLRRRGRHVQVGLLPSATGRPVIPMERVIAHELEILGSHGMAAHAYPGLLAQVADGTLRPDLLVTAVRPLAEAPDALAALSAPGVPGITVIEPWG
ncbi:MULTISPECIES: zinc-dependent alcohol dehydrogenase family protein [Streptomyces]|uniref:2-deoxy-scyllo-inosamine dehydrogenase n=1 Tax=Streptomyces odorifer TaxID=53450 RepID=A0A7Y6CAH2_9ACTN|nr:MULTISPECIES: zinc-dependent alcohol dehydrogenase family protein [Streptomyces]NUV36102.1 zinc-dependent alcohol dehydrogenase family protein [Streptomyces sp. KAI-27]NUV47848.1 zinc-dependent alcohol dehydrogenase family protein [Streptomyces sp. CAI-78]MBL0778925.1 zinc-dependent alcohol dehydrogenase family protein [Streptomyces albidoflavus]NUV29720.1 zinc-dependent alcohol dehydrogenase family protein [Streptomyces odorifer]UYX96017.1 zinc-dependent alcohol dehydrogenase family protei